MKQLNWAGYPVAQSLSAGSHLCNYLYYHLLSKIEEQGSAASVIFLHVPFLVEQLHEAVAWTPTVSKEAAVEVLALVISSAAR
jgi:pyrrolidone-carboxylate peptidase